MKSKNKTEIEIKILRKEILNYLVGGLSIILSSISGVLISLYSLTHFKTFFFYSLLNIFCSFIFLILNLIGEYKLIKYKQQIK